MTQVGSATFEKYLRVVNYMAVAQIFLRDNFLLERPLEFSDIKPRLLGHWGSVNGINIAYAHLSRLARDHEQEMMFVLGPGHGYAALQANLFAEGTLGHYYPEATNDYAGLAWLCRTFSWPYAFPSHANPKIPGAIYAGGELGYSLSTAFGAALDNPDLVVAAMVGDGEAETGPAAGAWQLNKLVDPRSNGVVLPILHLNGYKITMPTLYGRMDDEELVEYFRGLGYEPRVVDGLGGDVHLAMTRATEWAYRKIKAVKQAPKGEFPRLPMLILKTPKGDTGPKTVAGVKVAGNNEAHQVPLKQAMNNPEQLKLLETWLESYQFAELFDRKTGLQVLAKEFLPPLTQAMGMNQRALAAEPFYRPLILPEIAKYAIQLKPAGQPTGDDAMTQIANYLREVFAQNPDNFRLFSPDESTSNKLDQLLVDQKRAWLLPTKPWDKALAPDGRIMEMLSEHSLEGLHEGYVLTGRHGVLVSYEAFAQIISSMIDQYTKWLEESKAAALRGPMASLNFILTSTLWRQDHNGFSHQNPGLISDVLQHEPADSNVYLPVDANSAIVAVNQMLSSTNQVNVLVTGKTPEPQWRNLEQAQTDLAAGVSIWDNYSATDPEIVLVGAGDYVMAEVVAARELLRRDLPKARVRVINVVALSAQRLGPTSHQLTQSEFDEIFTLNCPIIFNFHGHPETLKAILYNYGLSGDRATVRGYIERGSITTPFDMHVRNRTSRFHLAAEAVAKLHAQKSIDEMTARSLILNYQQQLQTNLIYVQQNGLDDPEVLQI